jgi:hypothetical protein
MTQPTASRRPAGPPSLDELMGRFLAARKAGLVGDAPETGDVEPHEVSGGFRPTAASTWDEARAVFRLFGVEPEKLAAPPEWATFAALALPVAAVPLAAGLFPQRVRAIPTTLAGPAAAPESVTGLSGLRSWVRKTLDSRSPTALLLAAGIAAGLGDWDDADAALAAAEPLCEGAWRAVWVNQRAAVRWLRGDTAAAAQTWGAAGPDAPTALNLGMAELFAQKPGHGSRALRDAAARLPDDSGWSHLASLYLSLANAQG